MKFIKSENKNTIKFKFHIVQLNTKENMTMFFNIKKYFNDLGRIEISGNYIRYFISKKKDNLKVIEHFNNYPLKSKKFYYYKLWEKNYNQVLNKNITKEQILYEKSLFPKGINNLLRLEEKIFIPDLSKPLNPNWISGFINGDGNFTLNVHNNKKSGLVSIPMLRISQHIDDLNLLEKINEFFNKKGNIS